MSSATTVLIIRDASWYRLTFSFTHHGGCRYPGTKYAPEKQQQNEGMSKLIMISKYSHRGGCRYPLEWYIANNLCLDQPEKNAVFKCFSKDASYKDVPLNPVLYANPCNSWKSHYPGVLPQGTGPPRSKWRSTLWLTFLYSYCCNSRCSRFITLTSQWMRWRLESPATKLFTQPFTDQRKHQISASLAFVRGIHRSPVDSPHKGPVTLKMFPFDDVIMNPWILWYHLSFTDLYMAIMWMHVFQIQNQSQLTFRKRTEYPLELNGTQHLNNLNPILGVATICHLVRCMRRGHPSLFHAATSFFELI